MEKITVYGLPLNPKHLLAQIEKPSFCVSYGTRDRLGTQLEDAIELVDEDGILLVDNGAFTHFKSGGEMDLPHIEGFEVWARDILNMCPQAVAVSLEVIGGSPEANMRMIHEC